MDLYLLECTIDPAKLDMLIVLRAASADDAQAFIDAEPYNRSGGLSSIRIRPWSQVIPEPTPSSLRRTLDAERAGRPATS